VQVCFQMGKRGAGKWASRIENELECKETLDRDVGVR
jgi:hypothetical protein